MTLDADALSASLRDAFASLPATAHDAAVLFADAYGDYAEAGMFGASAPTIDGSRRDALRTTLEGGISVVPGTPVNFASAWATGVAAFWTSVPVAGAQSGVTTGCPGAASLSATLTATFANLANTASSCAASLAAALHTATQTVTATVAPPPNTVVPIA